MSDTKNFENYNIKLELSTRTEWKPGCVEERLKEERTYRVRAVMLVEQGYHNTATNITPGLRDLYYK